MGVDEVTKCPAVFLDRDGVLNQTVVVDGTPRPPRSPSELHLIPSAVEACRRLHKAGYVLVAVTNQPDVARGTQTIEYVQAINQVIGEAVPLDEFVVCPHDDGDGCDCRKPLPGMLLSAAARLDLDLDHSFMVGDRWRDIEAGRRAGCTTVFVDRGYTEKKPEDPDIVVRELVEAVPHMLAAYIAQQEGSRSNA